MADATKTIRIKLDVETDGEGKLRSLGIDAVFTLSTTLSIPSLTISYFYSR